MTRETLALFRHDLARRRADDGCRFSLDDKRHIAALLDDLGLDYIEGGYPGANPTDTAFFAKRPVLKTSRLRRLRHDQAGKGVRLPMIRASLHIFEADADVITYVAKTSDYHVHVALGCTLEENLEGISQSVEAAAARGREVILDCEHFFDGYKANPVYALACATAAFDAGARWIVLCDTNGGTLPHEVERVVTEVSAHIPGSHLGIHAHNDTENAVANSLAAVRGGARHIQGTLNGLGERCGNANLMSIIPTLLLKERLCRPLRDRRAARKSSRRSPRSATRSTNC